MPEKSDPNEKPFDPASHTYEVVNRPQGSKGEAAPIKVEDIIRQAAGSGRGRNPVGRTPAVPAAPPPLSDAVNVHAMLRANVAHASAAGLNELEPKPRRRSRRKRDYFLLLAVGNAAMIFFGGVTVFGIAGAAFLSSGLTWVMWFVMDDY